MKREDLIDKIHADKANGEYIAKTGKINGALRADIMSAMYQYAEFMYYKAQEDQRNGRCMFGNPEQIIGYEIVRRRKNLQISSHCDHCDLPRNLMLPNSACSLCDSRMWYKKTEVKK